MRNRKPRYPGRIKLIPVSGQPNTFDVIRADEPTEIGTPLNMKTLLSDETAASYGKDSTAVPDDILSMLNRSVQADTVARYEYAGQDTPWKTLPISGDLYMLCSDNSHIYVLDMNTGTMYSSHDAGQSWTSKAESMASYGYKGYAYAHENMACFTKRISGESDPCRFIYTLDGGETWKYKDISWYYGGSNSVQGIIYDSSKQVYRVYVHRFGTNQSAGYFDTTFNDLEEKELTYSTGVYGNTFKGMVANDDGRIALVSYKGSYDTCAYQYSTDYGLTWTNSNLSNANYRSNSLLYSDNSLLYLFTDSKIYYSSDWGKTWTLSGTPHTQYEYSADFSYAYDNNKVILSVGGKLFWHDIGKPLINNIPLPNLPDSNVADITAYVIKSQQAVQIFQKLQYNKYVPMQIGVASTLFSIFGDRLGTLMQTQLGQYTGTGESTLKLSFTISPKFIIILGDNGRYVTMYNWSDINQTSVYVFDYSSRTSEVADIVADSNSIAFSNAATSNINISEKLYTYIVFGE